MRMEKNKAEREEAMYEQDFKIPFSSRAHISTSDMLG